jgi:N-acetylmuramoyl-L-alanine amidase
MATGKWTNRLSTVGGLAALAMTATQPAAYAASVCPATPPLRVAVDIGHGRAVGGATSARGRSEFDFNARFATELVARATAERPALDLVLLNPEGEKMALGDRPARASARQASVFLSIHHDSVQPKYLRPWMDGAVKRFEAPDISGYSLFVAETNAWRAASLDLAREIGRGLRARGHTPTLHHAEPIQGENRRLLDAALGVYEAPFVVVTVATMPAILLELGVLVNRDEEARLDDPDYRRGMQDAILDALQSWCPTTARSGQAQP